MYYYYNRCTCVCEYVMFWRRAEGVFNYYKMQKPKKKIYQMKKKYIEGIKYNFTWLDNINIYIYTTDEELIKLTPSRVLWNIHT